MSNIARMEKLEHRARLLQKLIREEKSALKNTKSPTMKVARVMRIAMWGPAVPLVFLGWLFGGMFLYIALMVAIGLTIGGALTVGKASRQLEVSKQRVGLVNEATVLIKRMHQLHQSIAAELKNRADESVEYKGAEAGEQSLQLKPLE